MTEKRWNIPNALALFRLVGAVVLAGIAMTGATSAFAWLLLALLVSDWLDGKLAILLNQRTEFGARLDSTADAAMYGALLLGTVWLKWTFVAREWTWIAAVLLTFAVSAGAGLLKYGRVPSYHTRAAKTSWLLVGLAAVTVFADGPAWPFRVAMSAVIFTNLEATAMTCILSHWHADVLSLLHAWRMRHHGTPAAEKLVGGRREQAQHDQSSKNVPRE